LAYYTLDNFDQALHDFNKVIELDPDDGTAYHNRGLIYYNQGNYTLAMKDFDQAVRLDPDDDDAVYHKACVLALLGQDDACVTWLTQAIELNEEKREHARNNPDFESLWYKPAFRKLFGYQ
jgi:tetratricopeptide (TPR) repeat protein